MYKSRRTWLTKTFLIAVLLAALLLSACMGPRGWPGVQSQGGTLYVETMSGRLLALNPARGSEKWAWLPSELTTSGVDPGNLTSIGNVFLSCSRGQTGQLKPGYFYGAPSVADGMIYVGYFTGVVYAIDAVKGQEVWKHDIKSNIASGVTAAGDTVFVSSSNGKISALDAGNGSLKWEFSAENEVWASPAAVTGVVYFGSLDHSLYALNASDGTVKWTFKVGGGIGSTPLVVDAMVYFGSFDHKFYAIDADTGQQKWLFEGAGDWFWSEAVYGNGTIYVGCLDHNVYALDAGNGTPVWPKPFDASDQVKSSPVIVGGVLVVAAVDGKIYGLDLKTGEKKWEFDGIKAKILSPLCGAEGKVYINSPHNKLYALDGESGLQIWVASLSK